MWGSDPARIPCRKHRAGVDIHSCSQFLLELYSRWILPSSSARKTPVILISEVVRSVSLPPAPVMCAWHACMSVCAHTLRTLTSSCLGACAGTHRDTAQQSVWLRPVAVCGECHASVPVLRPPPTCLHVSPGGPVTHGPTDPLCETQFRAVVLKLLVSRLSSILQIGGGQREFVSMASSCWYLQYCKLTLRSLKSLLTACCLPSPPSSG